jgi:putative transposase
MFTFYWRAVPSRSRNSCRGCNNTQYFNRKPTRWGISFKARYKAIVCEKEKYLLTLVRYIHLNPIRAKLVQRLDDYPYSGHREYCGARGSQALETSRVLKMLGGRRSYQRFIQEGLRDGHREEYYDVKDQRFLGEKRFIEKLKARVEEEPETPRSKKPAMIAFRHAARALEVDPEVLSGADRSWEVSRHRALIGYILIRRLGYKLKDVAKCLGRDMTTVSSLISRYSERMADDEEWRKQSTRIAEDCLE